MFFQAIIDAALGYPVVPLMYPFSFSKLFSNYAKKLIYDQWPSQDLIRNVTCPILILHGSRDIEIASWQPKTLFDSALTAQSSVQPTHRLIPGEGELWLAPQLWYLDVKHGGHNSLSNYEIVFDTLEAWLLQHEL